MQAGGDEQHHDEEITSRNDHDHTPRLSRTTSEVRVPSRSPHPYHRHRIADTTARVKPDLASKAREEPFLQQGNGSNADVKDEGIKRRTSRVATGSPSESGTEADDEGISYTKALPAPPLRPRKGLKTANLDGGGSPELLTPTQIDEDAPRFEFPIPVKTKPGQEQDTADEEERAARAKFVKRRRAELARRVSEVALLGVIGALVLSNEAVCKAVDGWHRVELLSHVTVIAFLYLLYPIRLVIISWRRSSTWKPIRRTIRLPAAFDPAPILYPQFLPVLVALILLPAYPKVLLPNLVLGLATVPAGLYRFGNWDIEPLRWLVSAMPLIVSEHTDLPHKIFAIKPYMLKLAPPKGIEPEVLVSLYPLHQNLIQFVHYLTGTSLLPAEVHLMSIGLINLLLCAEMPHTIILQTILWVGGLGLFILCGAPIRWNIALARVPRWRLRRAGRIIQLRNSFLATLNQAISRSQSAMGRRTIVDSDADDDDEDDKNEGLGRVLSLERVKSELLGSLRTNFFSGGKSDTITEPQSATAVENRTLHANSPEQDGKSSLRNAVSKVANSRPRRNTLPNLGTKSINNTRDNNNSAQRVADGEPQNEHSGHRKRRAGGYGRTLFGRSYLSLTAREATARKWAYSAYVFTVIIFLIFVPLRGMISKYALDGAEPFGWAIGYLFGNIREVEEFVYSWGLESWIPLPLTLLALPSPELDHSCLDHMDMTCSAESLRTIVIGAANTRLLISAWCVLILILGLLVVLSFTFVEVDTRRKVFHGMMVAMLLPTIFIDPPFISLALIIILALFLILDLLRASQLPPLSRPIARFLTPYVDGRDLRGPVVVSHIFLLIGCAVPLWLSLAGMEFGGEDPNYKNWDVMASNVSRPHGRDVSMVSGVICVGMGDAAASLIGRRYGRRKWPWTGGKSLEGSLAFAVAVTTGLVVSKIWLGLGQWDYLDSPPADNLYVHGWQAIFEAIAAKAGPAAVVVWKAWVAACGASFMEAVLTGGNDNVVVPVVLWVLVKALDV